MIHILGKGDLSKEFVSFANLAIETCKFYDTDDLIDNSFIKAYEKGDFIYIAVTDPIIKQKFYDFLIRKHLKPSTYIHPSVLVGRDSYIGEGCIIQPNSIISNNVIIEDSVFINCNSNIGHDSIIGKNSSLMANVNVGGHCSIGNNTFVGTGAIIIPGIKVVENIKIGAGAVVIRNIRHEGTYFGNPAKKIF